MTRRSPILIPTRFDASRRHFMRTTALLSTAAGRAAPFATTLAAMSAAHAQTAGDYKALVCVFLYGGNDQGNTVLATDADSWSAYQRARATPPDPISLAAAGESGGVLPIVPLTAQSGRAFALHPNLQPVVDLFTARRAAVVANVGPLIAPITKAQYQAKSVALPRNLFSHNDQTSTWQASAPEGAKLGWGGAMGDLLASQNANTTFTCISAAGNAVWLSGQSTVQYQVGSNGAVAIGGMTGSLFGSSQGAATFRSLISSDRGHLLEKELNRTTARAIDAQALLNASMLATAALPVAPNTPGTTQVNPLAAQLRLVARIIGGRAALGVKRQVFFVSMGGFDTHDQQRVNQGNLLARLGQALSYFDGLMALPAVGAADAVTTFTASDFGRTLTSNGDGTDHGWGSHHFVTGAAVKGGDIYGRFPVIGSDTADDVGQGRLLPAVGVDQYAATMGRWFGLDDAQLDTVLPNLKNYGSARNLGFL